MNIKNIAVNTYKYFSDLEGNKHIASEYSLKKIIDVVENYKIKNILELGLGIGSISYCVLEFAKENNKKIKYVGTESNEFCLNVLPKYLKNHFEKIHIFSELKKVSNDEKFDLVIIDGIDENISKIKEIIKTNAIIMIEGDRTLQLKIIRETFPNSLYVRLISSYKSPDYGPNPSTDWCGGVQLIFTNPNFLQKLNFGYYKIVTAIKYRLRNFN